MVYLATVVHYLLQNTPTKRIPVMHYNYYRTSSLAKNVVTGDFDSLAVTQPPLTLAKVYFS